MRQMIFGCQPGFVGHARAGREEQFPQMSEMEAPWSDLEPVIEPFHPKPGKDRHPPAAGMMLRTLRLAALGCAAFLGCLSSAASNLVTGNGFGFAVVSPQSPTVTKFYAHPYSFIRPDPDNPLSEGIPTTNFIKKLSWSNVSQYSADATIYRNDSQVIQAHSSAGDGLFFMPFGFEQTALIVSWQPNENIARGSFQVEWEHPLKSQKLIHISATPLQLLTFDGIAESLLLIPLDRAPLPPPQAPNDLGSSRSWALLPIQSGGSVESAFRAFQRWRAGLSTQALAEREVAQVEQWRIQPAVHFVSEAERHLWRQSEIMLRIAQCREPNSPAYHGNGLIVASLPDGLWFTPWVRDMAYAAVAFARMGHRGEARSALMAYFNARPTGKLRGQTNGADYQVSVVRYFGDGSEEPFFTMEGSTNIEFDDWGLALWVLGEYLSRYNDPGLLSTSTFRGPLYLSARDYVVKPLLANLEPHGDGLIVAADTSIWEERQKDKKHFAFSTAAAIVGLRSFAPVARLAGDQATSIEVLHQAALLESGFRAAFIRAGELHGTLEPGLKNDIDGALLPIINWGVVPDSAVIRNAVERMQLLKVDSGGYRRVRSTYTDPAIFEYWYERQEFLFVDLSLAELDRRIGRGGEADAILQRIVAKASVDHNLIPEMYVSLPCTLFPGNMGDPTGALPMAGYGAGAFILHVIDRSRLEAQR